MRVTFKFYTYLKAIVGDSEISVDIKNVERANLVEVIEEVENMTGRKIKEKLLKNDAVREGIIFMINGKVISESKPSEIWIHDGDVISILPPGSGG
ncbi:MAG: MoaD/ThiS family protein [Candidatus Hydrothermia bacterium]